MAVITLPTLHIDQVKAFRVYQDNRFFALRAGRRWGKTDFGKVIAGDGAVKREKIGWFAPDHKRRSEVFYELAHILEPVKRSASATEGVIRTTTGGRIDFWTLEDEAAGRSRSYHKVFIDEGAFTKPRTMMDIWKKLIKPTLLDYRGRAIVASNTNGVDPENFFWRICNEPEHGFVEYHAPSHNNPYLPREDIEELERKEHPLVFAQEYRADFVDWSGVAFFSKDKMLDDSGNAYPFPSFCDTIFAVIDTAIKAGSANDGTAVTYFAKSAHTGVPLMVVDYDVVQIEGNSLRDWLPTIIDRCEELARLCGARMGVAGIWIEDMNSGTILLQHARTQGWNVHGIDTELTSKGKDGRALAVSSFHYQGLCKIAQYAYDKVITFKGVTRNHLLSQIAGFRIGDKDAAKRADDALDTYLYGLSLALGGPEGY